MQLVDATSVSILPRTQHEIIVLNTVLAIPFPQKFVIDNPDHACCGSPKLSGERIFSQNRSTLKKGGLRPACIAPYTHLNSTYPYPTHFTHLKKSTHGTAWHSSMQRELGEAHGELNAYKAIRPKRPAWWVWLFGGEKQ